jgi:hypothetical protein
MLPDKKCVNVAVAMLGVAVAAGQFTGFDFRLIGFWRIRTFDG